MADGAEDGTLAGDLTAGTYDACFELGHRFRLLDRRGTFRLSLAGLALGDYLVRNLTAKEIAGRILDIGTGSGAIALLLRNMGARSISATDISATAVATAEQNEIANFGDSIIDFQQCDLFPRGEADSEQFDLIVFNPPGWRTPSPLLKAELDGKPRSLDLEAMFYGDSVLLRFLQQLPLHLAEGGRVIIGLNSLIGIADIIEQSRTAPRAASGTRPHFRLLEQIELPLLFYTDEWVEIRNSLLSEFSRGQQEYAATYVTKNEVVHWFYEITEVTLAAPAAPLVQPSTDGLVYHA